MELGNLKSGFSNSYYNNKFHEEVYKKGNSTTPLLKEDNCSALHILFGPSLVRIGFQEVWEIKYKRDHFAVFTSEDGTDIYIEYLDRKNHSVLFLENKKVGQKIWDFEKWLGEKIEKVNKELHKDPFLKE